MTRYLPLALVVVALADLLLLALAGADLAAYACGWCPR